MNLHIVQPTTYTPDGKLYQTKKRRMVGLSLPYLAALTPREWKVTLHDERLARIDFDAPCDLAAITVWTRFSRRAYEIAGEYRKRGVPVLMGGPHAYFYGQEIAEHCDAHAVGEVDDVWPSMLEDARAGRLKKVYRQVSLPSMKGLPLPRYELFDMNRIIRPRVFQVQTTRGCPFNCEFCEETVLYGKKFRMRPVDELMEEIKMIKSFGGRIVFFADSVFAGSKQNVRALLTALIPIKVRWAGLWTMNYCHDRELVELARRSGCMHLNMGMESVDEETIRSMHKNQNKTCHYTEALRNLQRHGISYSLNFVFGWDTESSTVYDSTLRFLEDHHVPMAFFNLLSPRRGTAVYHKLKAEGRLLVDGELNKTAGMHCQFKPKNMKPEELVARVSGLHRSFYSLRSMLRRLRPRLRADYWVMLMFNLFQWNQARRARFGNLDPF